MAKEIAGQIKLQIKGATALLNISKESWDNKSIFILTNNQDFLEIGRASCRERV